MSKINRWVRPLPLETDEGWAETKINDAKKLEEKVIHYALLYLYVNWEEADTEDLEIDELVLDDTLRRLIKQRTEK